VEKVFASRLATLRRGFPPNAIVYFVITPGLVPVAIGVPYGVKFNPFHE
jgi:hypothetical protein